MNKTVRRMLIAVLGVIFLVSLGMVCRDLIVSRTEKKANAGLAEQVRTIRQNPDTEPVTVRREALNLPIPTPERPASEPDTQPGGEVPLDEETESVEQTEEAAEEVTLLPQYAWLWELNSDTAGWLRVDGTNVDYPVMYTPSEQDYYLRRAFDGSSARSGTLFIAVPWLPGHTLIYGHNMKDDSMFGTLLRYESLSFAQAHPTIQFDTLLEEGEYQVIAAFRGRAYDDADGFHYWEYVDLTEEARFNEYLEKVREVALYDTGVEVSFGDELLTMSTCSYHTSEGRFVVVAKRIR